MTEEPFGYNTDDDGFIDTEDSGLFFGYDFDGDGDIDADDDFFGFMMAEEGVFCFFASGVYGDLNHPQVVTLRRFRDQELVKDWWVKFFSLCKIHRLRKSSKKFFINCGVIFHCKKQTM